MRKAVFEGLVYDEAGRPVEVAWVGTEPHYVVEEQGMKFHVPTEQVDRQILAMFQELAVSHQDQISRAMAHLWGQDDPFTQAAIATHLRHLDQHFDELLRIGLPEDLRLWMGMMGFRVVINFRGEVLDVHFPAAGQAPDDDWGPEM